MEHTIGNITISGQQNSLDSAWSDGHIRGVYVYHTYSFKCVAVYRVIYVV
jgi:hypothetical protein